MVFNIRKGSPLRSPISRSPLPVAACDADKTPGQTGTAGTSGTAGTGGSPAGGAGTGGSATGTAGTGGSPAGGGGAGGGGSGGSTGAGGATAGTGGTAAAFIDTDVVLARFNSDGTLDTTFGTQGVARLDLGAGAQVGGRDTPWGIAKDAEDRLHVFAARKNTNGRTDTDRVVVRLNANGQVDSTFATMGVHTLDVGNVNDSTRNGFVQPDGKIVTAGYMGQATGVGAQIANRIVLARLNGGSAPATGGSGGTGGGGGSTGTGGAAAPAPGTLDATFGAMGIVSSNPFSSTDPLMPWGTAEAYGIARQSTGAYVTGGYGRSAATGTVNVLSFRYTAAGVFDTTWGTTGVFEKDLTGEDDRARNVVVLPNDRVMLVGSAVPAAGNVDGMIMILTANGALDTTFNTTGYKIYKFDANSDRPEEALFGAAVSPNGMFAAAAGYRNAATQSTATNDDAVLVILPLAGTGTEFAGVVPLSATSKDRFWAVTFDANNKIVAAGYVADGIDQCLAVARFNTDGTLDTTFGAGGVARVNASPSTASTQLEEARGVVVQSDGKIVIGGSAEH